MLNHSQPEQTKDEKHLTDVQALVVELIHCLLSVGFDEVDAAITDCLGRVGRFSGRDRAYVFVCRAGYTSNTHEWCAPGIAPMIDRLQNLPNATLEGFVGPLSKNETILLADIRDLPDGSTEQKMLQAQGIRSVLMVPMIDNGSFFGLVGFDSVTRRGDFVPGEVYLLRAFADVVRAVLTRRKATQAIGKAQEDLARERAFLQGIVSTNASGFLVFDEQGVIIYANDASEDILGVAADDLIGKPFDSPDWKVTSLQGQPISRAQMPFSIVMQTGEIVQNHRVAVHCDGSTRYVSINAAPIANAVSARRRVVYAVTDVTALVEAEQEREAALAAAQHANEAKSNFLANMSHEIRTPLNGILGISSMLGESLTDPAQRQMVSVLQDSGNLLMSIINDLLDMTKIEADALVLEHIPFSLSQLARRIEDVHTLRASEKGLSFAVHLDDPSGRDRLGDPHRLMQIIHNLVSNALKFTEFGFVHVRLSAPDDAQIRLQVSDSGIGMSAEQQAKVLEPFMQADTTISRRFGGTGLGMSIVSRLIDMMQGTLTIESAPGKGTRVTITLPLAAAPATDKPECTAPVPIQGVMRPLRVLAADDNRTNQMILGMMLGQLGASVTMADDGLAALDHYRAGTFDVMLLDISMPKLDGVTLLSTLRSIEASEGRKRVPAFAFTANAMTHQIQGYLDAGFDGCLTKPLRLERLRETLLDVINDDPPSD